VTQSASRASQFYREGEAGRNSGREAKEKTKAKAVADAENEGVGYGACKQAEWTVLSAEQIVGEIKATEDIETSACNADGSDGMMVH